MSVYKKNNKFVSYLIVLIALFILVLVTKDQLFLLQERLDVKETNNQILNEKKDVLDKLNKKQDELEASSENIDKYLVEINEEEIIEYIYSNIEDLNDKQGVTIIKSLTISEPSDTEMGFKETLLKLTLIVPNELKLKKILDFLTLDNPDYNFFITSFSFPYWNTDSDFSVTIPLKLLHK